MTACSPYDSSPAARGSSDGQCPKDWQTIRINRGVATEVNITVEDPALDDIDFPDDAQDQDGTDDNEDQVVRFIFREYYDSTNTFVAYAQRTSSNTFTISFTKAMTAMPGLFIADLVIYDQNNPISYNVDSTTDVPDPGDIVDTDSMRPIYVQRMFLEVAPNNLSGDTLYPVTIADIRLSIRDMCPGANFLLDDFEYTDKDIFAAIRNGVDLWNETPPTVSTYTPTNFPFRYHLKMCAVGHLLCMRGIVKLRDWLPYQGGNISVNDNSTWQAYHQMGQDYIRQYKEFMMRKKVEQNIDGGFGFFSGATTGW